MMGKIMSALVMLFLAVGCATSGDIKKLNSDVQKIAKATTENRQFIKDHIKPEVATAVATEEEEVTGAPPAPPAKLILKKPVLPTFHALTLHVEELAARTTSLEQRLGKVEKTIKLLPDLHAYVARLKEREAKHLFKDDPVEKLTVYFIGPFAIGQSKLNRNLRKQLKKVRADLESKNLKVKQVDAFASITGTPERNKILSEARGKTVAAWLEKKGIKVDKIQGLGGVTRFGRRADNRCVIIFAKSAPEPELPIAPE